ncbi:MAG: methionine adenosyltransferase [Candidatus Aminicenantes bacterium]|nr:methionine adenosyltransferase [Candidatus Aminicenantes bacterium]
MDKEFLFTSESVSEGHPDKMADRISDAVLDALFRVDPTARVACESLLTQNTVIVAGELGTSAEISVETIVRETVREIGYIDPSYGFDAATCVVKNMLGRQSADIANAVVHRTDGEIGAGDQGLMFGYAVRETPELMPLPITLAHRLVERQSRLRKSGRIPWLRPDAKSQVTVRYIGGRPVAVERVVLSTQHAGDVANGRIAEEVRREIVDAVIPAELRSKTMEYYINPSGRFEIGGPQGDTGLTGRKIIVDTYGGSCPHGGGAFSGKDPTKVDRSAAYAARYIAKNVVAAGLAEKCTVQLSYAIGVVEPQSLMINLHGQRKVEEREVEKAVREMFRLTPKGMIEMLDLRRPIYTKTAAYGHFGREIPEFSWERTDKAEALRRRFGV